LHGLLKEIEGGQSKPPRGWPSYGSPILPRFQSLERIAGTAKVEKRKTPIRKRRRLLNISRLEGVELQKGLAMILIVQQTARRNGLFDGWIEGSQVVISGSRQPFLDAARELIKRGVDPATILTMRHKKTGTNSLRRPIGKAAKPHVTTSKHGRPVFEAARKYSSKPQDEPKTGPGGEVPKTAETEQIERPSTGPAATKPPPHPTMGATGALRAE